MNLLDKEIITRSAKETHEMGQLLADEIIKSNFSLKHAFVIGLEGDLGSGKTVFVQGLARGLKLKEKITSPTFVILRKHRIGRKQKLYNFFYHIDCYRLDKAKELEDLGIEEILSLPKNIVVIEWAEKVKRILPKDTLWLKFKHRDKNRRAIKIIL